MRKSNGNGNGFDGLVAVQLCTRSWPGIVNLTPKDLGIEDKEVPEFFHLGNKKLYPSEWRLAFNRKINEARRYLNNYTFEFVLEWVRCSPKNGLARIIEKLEQHKAEYLLLVEEFCEKYDQIREEWKVYCEEKWPGSWELMAPHYPNKETLRRKFDFFWTVTEIKAAEPPAKTSAPEVIAAYERAKIELEAKCKEAVELAFLDYMKRIREVVAKLANDLKEEKIIRNDSLQKVRDLHDWARDMNIFGHQAIEDELAKLKAGLDGVDIAVLKNTDGLRGQLADLADQVAGVASRLDDVSSISGNYKRMISLD